MPTTLSFPPRGLSYLWFLNGDCRLEDLRPQIRAFGQAKVGAVVLHARDGLLVPYMSRGFLELFRTVIDELAAVGVQSWIYDEDYCPSGQAGGRVLADHPEFLARNIQRFEAPADLKPGELFFFDRGVLLWAGVVGPTGSEPVRDLTHEAGMIRRTWEASEWDSRWYYFDTPFHPCPRCGAYVPEYAITMPALPAGHKLVAFVAVNAAPDSPYDGIVDALNPAATDTFLRVGYEPYVEVLGDRLGTKVPAIFADEPKFNCLHPWTGDLFTAFQARFGYDLRPRLEDLFSYRDVPSAMRTRLDYRDFVANRFDEAWVQRVAQWCTRHGLKLSGHISPEDDILCQVGFVGNLFPLMKRFVVPGMDLIIPFVGDETYATLNVGVVSAVSSSQQQRRGGVMSEILGASGLDAGTQLIGKILGWQTMQGVTIPVIHAAVSSVLGLRSLDAPPNCGPNSARWQGMIDIQSGLLPIQDVVTDSVQAAPVAILWPYHAFAANLLDFTPDAMRYCAPRVEYNHLLLACLQAQVSAHLLDEQDLHQAAIQDAAVRIGDAAYQVILVRRADLLDQATLDALARFQKTGGKVYFCGDAPRFANDGKTVKPCANLPGELIAERPDWTDWCRANLPRLALTPAAPANWLRITQWTKAGQTASLLMNLSDEPRQATVNGVALQWAGGEILIAAHTAAGFTITGRFNPHTVTPKAPDPRQLALTQWQCRFDDEPWHDLKNPLAVYQLKQDYQGASRLAHMVLTGKAALSSTPVAKTLDYRVQLPQAIADPTAVLVLEPTAQRGRFTITVGSHTWQAALADTDTRPITLDLTAALAAGGREILFRLESPTSFDGIKWPPKVIQPQGQSSAKTQPAAALALATS
jgi:hypothetical protein